jgi:hypothetical protein
MCSLCRSEYSYLNLTKATMGRDQEVVKRSGRNEPIWVSIHIYMVTMIGNSLYTYLYLKLAKNTMFSYYLSCFLFNKIREQEGRTDSAWKWEGVAQIMYIHVSKCKNDKINFLIMYLIYLINAQNWSIISLQRVLLLQLMPCNKRSMISKCSLIIF